LEKEDLRTELYSGGSVRLAPVEDLIASIRGITAEEVKKSAELEEHGDKLRVQQRVELCERLASGNISPNSFEILWEVLFQEKIANGCSRSNSSLFDEILKLNGERLDD
jgi:hypothetical protein